MKKMIKLVAGAVTFGVLSGSVFTGTEYALNRVTGSGITQTQSSKTAATTTKQSDDSTSGITQTSASTSDSKLAGVSDVADYVLPSIVAIDVKVVSQTQDFFGRTYQNEQSGSGSGIIMKVSQPAHQAAPPALLLLCSLRKQQVFCANNSVSETLADS